MSYKVYRSQLMVYNQLLILILYKKKQNLELSIGNQQLPLKKCKAKKNRSVYWTISYTPIMIPAVFKENWQQKHFCSIFPNNYLWIFHLILQHKYISLSLSLWNSLFNAILTQLFNFIFAQGKSFLLF